MEDVLIMFLHRETSHMKEERKKRTKCICSKTQSFETELYSNFHQTLISDRLHCPDPFTFCDQQSSSWNFLKHFLHLNLTLFLRNCVFSKLHKKSRFWIQWPELNCDVTLKFQTGLRYLSSSWWHLLPKSNG